jgi:hypothetical protein
MCSQFITEHRRSDEGKYETFLFVAYLFHRLNIAETTMFVLKSYLKTRIVKKIWIWGSYSGDYEDCYLQGCDYI